MDESASATNMRIGGGASGVWSFDAGPGRILFMNGSFGAFRANRQDDRDGRCLGPYKL